MYWRIGCWFSAFPFLPSLPLRGICAYLRQISDLRRVTTAPAGSDLGTAPNQAPPIYMEHMENVEEYMGGALFRSISFLGGDNMLCQGEESILK